MNTFLPYHCFKCSARVLDDKRLGKQRVEAKQILNTILGLSRSWQNHPAVKMWQGYNEALVTYGITICEEWIERGFQDNLLSYFRLFDSEPLVYPPWFGDKRFHASHRSNLLRKKNAHYSQFNWPEESTMRYYWPVNNRKPSEYREPHRCLNERNINSD